MKLYNIFIKHHGNNTNNKKREKKVNELNQSCVQRKKTFNKENLMNIYCTYYVICKTEQKITENK